MATVTHDVLVAGAGFGGIMLLHFLRKLGLDIKVIDKADGVGGTWYWNRYPGAMSDTESYIYRFSWDNEDLVTYPWPRHYLKQAEVLAYLEHVATKYDLRRDMLFKTELLSAEWDGDAWSVSLSNGETWRVRYLITALGLLSDPVYPDIPGLKSFKGVLAHTAKWPQGIELEGKRVGLIGNGSTGIQVVTAIADKVKSLHSFQRTPQYSVPSGDRPVEPEYRKWVNENYEKIFEQVRNSAVAFGFPESTAPYNEVPPEKREAIFEELWQKGNGFRFMFGGFSDIITNKEANEAACNFIRKKIGQIVKDPVKVEKLKPTGYYARRPLCDGGYYEQFNRDNVDIVNLKDEPIVEITETGIKTSKAHYDLDVLILATGFDAVDGSYNRIRFHGRGGETIKDHWQPNGPTSFLGMFIPNFPNMMLISGPQGPFTNLPPALEAYVGLVVEVIAKAEEVNGQKISSQPAIIEAYPEAEEKWVEDCERTTVGTLFKETASWIFGNNVPGKKIATRFYFGGLKNYYAILKKMRDDGYAGLKPFIPELAQQTQVDGTTKSTNYVEKS
jgi:cyclohexanone monooxygenase